uniref:Cysteine repeat modular protein 4 n=1 Tax=Parastrongyloides trichosuri TaxID=131310 RepID=A0A0N4ZVN0_PARTI
MKKIFYYILLAYLFDKLSIVQGCGARPKFNPQSSRKSFYDDNSVENDDTSSGKSREHFFINHVEKVKNDAVSDKIKSKISEEDIVSKENVKQFKGTNFVEPDDRIPDYSVTDEDINDKNFIIKGSLTGTLIPIDEYKLTSKIDNIYTKSTTSEDIVINKKNYTEDSKTTESYLLEETTQYDENTNSSITTTSSKKITKTNNIVTNNNKENKSEEFTNTNDILENEEREELKNIFNNVDKFELFTKEDILKSSKRKQCMNTRNKGSIFFSSSITEHDMLSFHGIKNGTICKACSDGYLLYFKGYQTNKIDKDNEPIADISCLAGGNLCLCDHKNNCYIPNSNKVSIMLYPACIKGKCHVYAILAGYERNDALISIDNSKLYFSINQINFKTKQYWPLDTDGVYIIVKSIGCNGCGNMNCINKLHHKRNRFKG